MAALSEAAALWALLVAFFLGPWAASAASVGAAFVLGAAPMAGVAVGAMVMGRRGGAG